MLSRAIWLELGQETRIKLEKVFNLKKSAGVEVAGNKVICDGFTDRDLSAISLKALQEALGSSENDFYKLFDRLVSVLEGSEEKPVLKEEPVVVSLKGIEVLEDETVELEAVKDLGLEVKKKRGRPFKITQ